MQKRVAHGNRDELANFALRLGLLDYPEEVTLNDDRIEKTALQYIENHDHSRFVCNFATSSCDNELLGEGDRNLWYKVQPYLVGIFAAKGIPPLWQSQEFGENYYRPEQGMGRVLMFRPVRWDYFYDRIGKKMIGLVRKLSRLRGQRPQFRYGEHFFYNHHGHHRHQSMNVMLFSRRYADSFSLIALNFGDQDQEVLFDLPFSGDYREELHGYDNLRGVVGGEGSWLTIPSNYGRIWTLETGL